MAKLKRVYIDKFVITTIIAIFSLGCSNEGKEITTQSGLKYKDIKEGTGPNPSAGKTVVVQFVGSLENGRVFESSVDKGHPFEFVIGSNQVIPGWEEGVMTMKTGGRRKLIIPPSLAWGNEGAGGVIPPGATVIFDIELLEVK